MSDQGPYHAFDRMILHAVLVIGVTLAFALGIWIVLAQLGITLPLPWVLTGVAGLAGWTILDARGAERTPPAPPPPPAPRRPLTWEDAERMAALYRAGHITHDQLEAALRELVPPPPPDPPDRPRRR